MSPLRAAIVAGGRGVRMRPATDNIPKPLLPVAGRPLLEHLVGWLGRSGVEEAFMCLGYRADAIEAHFGDGSRWGLRLAYQQEREPRGTAGCVRDLGERAGDDLLVVYGDLFVDMDCAKLMDFHRSHDAAATLVVHASDHPLDSDLVRVSGDRIAGFFRAKAGEPFENIACAAVWVVRRRLLERVPLDRPTDFGKDIFPAALAAGETLMAYRTTEEVLDVGTPERVRTFEARRASGEQAPLCRPSMGLQEGRPAAAFGRWAAFLDRDGTLIEEVGHLHKLESMRPVPGAAAAVRRIREAGGLAIIVTNQPVVARGMLTEEQLGVVHARLAELFAAEGARFDAIYYCPHHPEKNHPEAADPKYRRECECRKPKTGMLLEAARRFGIDVSRSFLVGDTSRDMQTARNAGCKAVLVETGYAGKDGLFQAPPDVTCPDIGAAADWIVSQVKSPKR